MVKKESKFGMDIERAERFAQAAVAMRSIRMVGVHMHIDYQITSSEPYPNAVSKGVELIGRLRHLGHPITWYNMGEVRELTIGDTRLGRSRSSPEL